ncbi:MAG: tetratricopeptide repeat protein, partial [Ignavibacteriaceae bacterium]|nr:tetratricopeptide repeat protein [Ignavibacteriaceae bacterium]
MLFKKVLIAVIISLSTIVILLSGCAKDSQDQKEVPITTNSDDALKSFLNGRDVFEKLKFPQAAELFDQAIAQDKNFAMAYLYRASSGGGYKIARENMSKAVELLDKVSEGEKHLILYNKTLFDNDGVNQKQELDSLLNLFPDDKRVQNLAGVYYYSIQDYPNALNHFKKAVAIDSNFAPSYNTLGYVNVSMENFAAAEESFKKYLELIPDEANPYDSYAELLLTQGRYDESIEQYNKAIQTDPEFVTALVGIGNNYIFKEDYNKARDYYQQYYDKSFNINQKLDALWWKAVSYIHEGNIVDAIKVFDERSKLAFENNFPTAGITGYRFSGWTLADNGNINEAEKYFNKAFDYIKSSEMSDADRKAYEIYVGLDRCYLQTLKKDIKGTEKNLDKLKQIVDKRQESTEIELLNFITGFLQFYKGNNDLALQYFQKIGEGNPYFWYWEA